MVATAKSTSTSRYFGLSVAFHFIVITFFSFLVIHQEEIVIPPTSQSVTVMLSDAASRCPVLSSISPSHERVENKPLASSAMHSIVPTAIPVQSTALAHNVVPSSENVSEYSPSPVNIPVSAPATVNTPLTTASFSSTKVSSPSVAHEPRMSEASYNAAYLNNSKPIYPKMSKRLGEEGIVILKVRVLADGSAGSVSILKSSEFERLDLSALEAVKQWKFVAAKRGDNPVESWVSVPITFKLDA